MLKKTIMLSALLGATVLTQGCSVGMALSGEKDPNLNVVKEKASRVDIEAQLGAPASVEKLNNGETRCVYKYQVGNAPSAGRAVAHGAMDVLTFGIWEIVGTPVEAAKGTKYEAIATYDKNNKLVNFSKRKK